MSRISSSSDLVIQSSVTLQRILVRGILFSASESEGGRSPWWASQYVHRFRKNEVLSQNFIPWRKEIWLGFLSRMAWITETISVMSPVCFNIYIIYLWWTREYSTGSFQYNHNRHEAPCRIFFFNMEMNVEQWFMHSTDSSITSRIVAVASPETCRFV